MRSSDEGNRPRWTGQPGFFEIWFLVVFDPGGARAWWFRYTTFAPAAGVPGAPRATLWAAAFDAHAPALAGKTIVPIAAYDAGPGDRFAVRVGSGEIASGASRGEVDAGGHRLAWELRFTPAAHEARRGPRLLDHLPLPTRVSHANTDVAFTGWVSVDDRRHDLRDAPGVQKHLWGTRRVEELVWLYCPRFTGDPAARLEATFVRLRRDLPGPPLVPVWARTAAGEFDWCGLPAALRGRIEPAGPGAVRFRARSATRALAGHAWCDPRTLAGYVYRDPAGFDLHVAQSDVASCEVDVFRRPHPLAPWRRQAQLRGAHAAALEFHAPEPLPGVRYIPWDGTALPG